MSDSRPKPKVASTAKVLSAFVQAFSKTLMSGRSTAKSITAQIQDTPEGVSRLWARNAKMVMEEGIALLIDQLQAEIHVTDPLTPLIPEKKESYAFHIQRGRIGMDAESLSTLMNRYAFPAGTRSPLYDFRISLPEGRLQMQATFRVNRFMSIGISLAATMTVNPDGLLILTPVEIRSGSIPIDKIMGLLGVQMSRLMPAEAASAFVVEGDRIFINPVGLFPAPKTTGLLVHAEVTGDHLVMTYDNGASPVDPPLIETDSPVYLAMLGHDLLVGKITMTDVCLQMVPLDPAATWVELSMPHYRAQLAQGESSLKFGDELLYRIPTVADLQAMPTRPALKQLPSAT
jgi:hypothetical protein